MIPTTNKLKRVGKTSTVAIDHVIVKCIIDCQFETATLKTDESDHFSIAMAFRTDEPIHQSQ